MMPGTLARIASICEASRSIVSFRSTPRLEQHAHRLRLDTGDENAHAVALHLLHRGAKRLHASGIHRQHLTHAENDRAGPAATGVQSGFQLVGGGKEKRAVKTMEHHALGHEQTARAIKQLRVIFLGASQWRPERGAVELLPR